MNTLSLRRDTDYLTLSYVYRLGREEELTEKSFVVPSAKLRLNFKLILNGRRIQGESYSNLVEKIGSRILHAPLWESLGYIPNLLVENETTATTSFSIQLSCQIFDALRNSQQFCSEELEMTNTLEEMTVVLEMLTEKPSVELFRMVQNWNYMLTSFLANMEYKFPVVFSYYGRKLFALNYKSMLRCIDEICDVQMYCLGGGEINKQSVLAKNLEKLQKVIMTEYNLINNMLEIAGSRNKYKSCVEAKKSSKNSGYSLKSRTYSVKLIDYEEGAK